MFSLVHSLPSPASAADGSALFGWLTGTTERSDSSTPFMRAVRLLPSPAGLGRLSPPVDAEVSRFSCMQFLSVLGVYDYAGPVNGSRFRRCPCCLPLLSTGSAPQIKFYEAQYPAHRCLCLRFDPRLAAVLARLKARMVRYSFPVGLFHSQLHAGLSRRTDSRLGCDGYLGI